MAFLAGGYASKYIDNSNNQEIRSNGLMHGTDWTPTILGIAGVDVATVEQDLQDKLYIPVAKQASLNEHGTRKHYKKYLMEKSFDGHDVSQWLLTGDEISNLRTKYIPLSINTLDSSVASASSISEAMIKYKEIEDSVLELELELETENIDIASEVEIEADKRAFGTPDYSSSIIFTSEITGNLYKLIYLDDAIKHLSKKAHYCTFRTVTDSETNSEYLQRTQTVGVFATTNAFLFDLTLDSSESTNLLEVLTVDSTEEEKEEEEEEDEDEDVDLKSDEISSLDDYDKNTVASIWNEGVLFVNTEYIDNNPMFNDYLTCQQAILAHHVDPSLFGGAFSPFFTWDEYTSELDSLCSDDINPVLSVMYSTKYQDYGN